MTVDVDKIVTSVPRDTTAALVVSKGTHWNPQLRESSQVESDVPLEIDHRSRPGAEPLVGRRFGHMTVMGLSPRRKKQSLGKGKGWTHKNLWVVRCDCGRYALRVTRSIKNPKNDKDACRHCHKIQQMQRSYEWRRTERIKEAAGEHHDTGQSAISTA